WRPALLGTFAGLGLLAVLVMALGPLLDRIPIHALQFVFGMFLLFFCLRWLREAILLAAAIIPLHDELAVFAEETAQLQELARREKQHLNLIAGIAAFKAVVLEGLEVVFIVIAVGAGRGLLGPASLGALAACALVVLAGIM